MPLLVHGVHIDGVVVLYHSVGAGYGTRPVYLVEPRVHILDDEQEELLVVLVELNQRQQDIQEGVVSLTATFVHLCHLAVIHYRGIVALVVIEYHYGTIDPHREVVDEILLHIGQRRFLVDADDVFRTVLAKHQFLPLFHLQQHLGKNKDTVVYVGVTVEIISNIIHRDVAFDILQNINTVDCLSDIVDPVSVFFYQDAHSSYKSLSLRCCSISAMVLFTTSCN